jgi:hypothetical protein
MAAMATETATATEMATVTAMAPMLTPSALPLNAQQVGQKIPRHKSERCSSLTGQNGRSINQGMNRLPYNLADQRSHIGRMATIATILIRVISLLGKWNELTREVFWWLVAGREHLMIFSRQKSPRCTLGGSEGGGARWEQEREATYPKSKSNRCVYSKYPGVYHTCYLLHYIHSIHLP